MSEIIGISLKDTEKEQTITSKIGEFGETIAAEFLNKQGFRLVATNFKAPIGRTRKGVQFTGEIDLIAFDKNETLCFVEVKTRSSDEFASPLSAVDLRKQRQITRTARVYRKIFKLNSIKFRYDVISIVLNNNKAPKIELIKEFWTEHKFRKKVWVDQF
ncbi:MAG: YraN family protein [Acidobacteriota bacterium]|jgi:putative endonuclease|nr:YraN family protein [Acidobacteriota bacterium]